jgi:hypothetical protein
MYYQEFFNMGMWTFDAAWRSATEYRSILPNTETFEQCLISCRQTMEEVIKKRPRNLEAMWDIWYQMQAAKGPLKPAASVAAVATTSTAVSSSEGGDIVRVQSEVHLVGGNLSRNSKSVECELENRSYEPITADSMVQDGGVGGDEEKEETVVITKTICGVTTKVHGGSSLLTPAHIDQIESVRKYSIRYMSVPLLMLIINC